MPTSATANQSLNRLRSAESNRKKKKKKKKIAGNN